MKQWNISTQGKYIPLVPGSQLGYEDDMCFFPYFRSINGLQDTWYLGNAFMYSYYVVFDMTPLDEFGKNYI